MSTEFLAGFARSNITPMLGIGLSGYYEDRPATAVLDELEAVSVAFSLHGVTEVFVSLDLCAISMKTAAVMRTLCSEATGVPKEQIHILVMHSHTTPIVEEDEDTEDPLVREYTAYLKKKVADVARAACEDMKPARIGEAVGRTLGVSFKRRFRMKDGTVRTNPGVNNPDILEPIGPVDERVHVLRMDQEGGRRIVIANFANHADTIGGSKMSADWPGFTRRTVERALENTRCIVMNGAEGDVSTKNVFRGPGKRKGYDYMNAQHIGNVVAGAVMQVFEDVNWFEPDAVKAADTVLSVPSNRTSPENLPEAHRIKALYEAGREDELPYTGMERVTVIAEAIRMVDLENGPDAFYLPMSAARIGRIGMIMIPGEAFADIGFKLKETEGFKNVFVIGEADGCGGYYPTTEAYEEGGYEARSSKFRKGVGDLMIEAGRKLLKAVSEE